MSTRSSRGKAAKTPVSSVKPPASSVRTPVSSVKPLASSVKTPVSSVKTEPSTPESSRPRRKRTAKQFGDDFITATTTPTKRGADLLDTADLVLIQSPKKKKVLVKKEGEKKVTKEIVTKKIAVADEKGDGNRDPPKATSADAGKKSRKDTTDKPSDVPKADGDDPKADDDHETDVSTGDHHKVSDAPKVCDDSISDDDPKATGPESNDAPEVNEDELDSDGVESTNPIISESFDEEECEETFGKPVYVSSNTFSDLSYVQALDILENERHKTCISRTDTPKAGEAYLFDTTIVRKLWQEDGFDWQRISNGRRVEISSGDSTVTLLLAHDIANSPDGKASLSRFSYRLDTRRHIILVYYKDNKGADDGAKIVEDTNDVSETEDISQEDFNTLETESKELASYFDYQDALDLLNDSDGKLSTEPPKYPKGGEVYFYDTYEVGDMWRFDSYLWRNCGKRSVPRHDPKISKAFYLIRLSAKDSDGSSKFRRVVYRSLSKPNIIMVHYVGDETVFVPRPHGNRKHVRVGDVYTPSPTRRHSMSRISSAALKGIKIDSMVSKKLNKRDKMDKMDKKSLKDRITMAEDETDSSSTTMEKTGGSVTDSNAKGGKPHKRVKPLMITETQDFLPFDVVIAMLENHADEASTAAARFPKNGEAYLYNVAKIGLTWKQDGYAWADQRSTIYYPRDRPVVVRKIHGIVYEGVRRGSKIFQRCTFHLIVNPKIILVHYLGDHDAAGRPADFDNANEVEAEKEGEQYIELNESAQLLVERVEAIEAPVETETPDEVQELPEEEEEQSQTLTTLPPEDQEQFTEEFVQMKLKELNQQKNSLEQEEKKLLQEIRNLKEEREQFYEEYGHY